VKRTILIGESVYGGDVEIEIKLEPKSDDDTRLRLSMVGAVWQRNRRDWESGGQNYESLKDDCAELFIPEDKLDRMLAVWRRWHLNDLQAGCEHQRASWDTTKKVTLRHYGWTTKFLGERRRAESGSMQPMEYAEYRRVAAMVHSVTTSYPGVKFESDIVRQLLADGWVKLDHTEEKATGWVYPQEHPEGLLCKPCDVCGHGYGSRWLFEEIPADVVAEIQSW
jgi:hypothetical protein